MRRSLLVTVALFAGLSPALAQPATQPSPRAVAWQAHVATLASDAMEGREAGTPGHQRAVAYLVAELTRLGLEPAGTEGFLQPIPFVEQRFSPSRSGLTLGGQPVALPGTAIVSAARPLPERIDAPLVFVGYGLSIPDAGHDDLAGVDLAGKMAVVVTGRPQGLPANAVSAALGQRWRTLAARGAVGMIVVGPVSAFTIPWGTMIANPPRPGIYLRPEAGDPTGFAELVWNPEENDRLFAGSGHDFADVAAAAIAGRRMAGFPLRPRLAGSLAASRQEIFSPNVVARLPGSDPALRAEHVVLTAHTDGEGIGEAVNGDTIYNGALDNAAGTAALLDIAAQLKGRPPRRSLLFTFVTAEEKGLLGSRYFVRHPTVPRESIVANLNYDMALPLYPLRSVTVLGAEESSLGADAAVVGAGMGLMLAPDPFPERNSFIRSDQFSFIEAGIPAVAFKFGFAAGTPEAELERAFRAERYHRPSDDLSTPIFVEDEIRLHDFIGALAARIANAEGRPAWNATSRFRQPPAR